MIRKYKLYDNQSNTTATNIFDSVCGVLNNAPIKISGQYKIVIDLNNNLFLDDYTGRRVVLDKTKNFIKQVANFLSVGNNLVSTENLYYGAYQNSTKKYYHIPYFLGDENNSQTPKYFVVTRSPNSTIKNENDLLKYGKILRVVDFDKIGITNIFNEIYNEEKYICPLTLNFSDSDIKLYGCDIAKGIPTTMSFDLKDSQANQPYFATLNNRILNAFNKNNIFYPKFINIEVEFSYANDTIHFNNFYGFISSYKEISINDVLENKLNIILQDYVVENYIEFKQKTFDDSLTLSTYKETIASGSIKKLPTQKPQIKFRCTNLVVGDDIKIYNSNGLLDYSYRVIESDIDLETPLTTMITIAKNATFDSKLNYVFSVTKVNNNFHFKIVSNVVDIFLDEYYIELPYQCTIIERFSNETNVNNFRGISDKDIWLCGQPNLLDSTTNISIEDIDYTIVEKFIFENKTMIRLNKTNELLYTQNYECKIIDTKNEKLIELNSLPLLNYECDLISQYNFEQLKYVNELFQKFDAEEAIKSINDFAKKIIQNTYQLINDKMDDDLDKLSIENYNESLVKNMIFSNGVTSFLTPNTLNIDKHFSLQNGNLDTENLNDNDYNRYNWFLINSETPNYLKENVMDVRSLRFFDKTNNELPKISSKLKRNGNIVECIFLGVKYQLPLKYENYLFSVYLNYNNRNDISINYSFEIDIENKTLYLSINKYLNFTDLLRGADENNTPFIDLSFFYAVEKSYSKFSEFVPDFKKGSLKLCDAIRESEYITFNNQRVFDWKINEGTEQYICLRRHNIFIENTENNLLDFFPISGDYEFYVYSKILFENVEYELKTLKITVEKIKTVTKEFLWCSDVKIRFYNDDYLFLKIYDENNVEQTIKVAKTDVTFLSNSSLNIFGSDIENYSTSQNELFKTVDFNNDFSLKENYFEIVQKTNSDTTKTKSVFKFNDFKYNLTDNEIIDIFDFNQQNIDDSIYEEKITLFDRHPLWKYIQNLFKSDIVFKIQTLKQIRQNINQLMITNLKQYIAVNAVIIENSSPIEYINFDIKEQEKNVVIWNDTTTNKIYNISRFKTNYYPFFQLANSEIDFQFTNNKKYETIFNIYDANFNGENISATGFWREVTGNIVSSLFCKENAIVIIAPFVDKINYKEQLKKTLTLNDIIILHDNKETIEKIDKNYQSYLIDIYADYMLNRFYNLSEIKAITENDEKRLQFSIDSKEKYQANLASSYNFKFTNIKLIFTRK